MKTSKLLLILLVTLSTIGFSQKPKKTHDSHVFAKKVKFSFVPEYVNSRGPDIRALQYISDATGNSLDEITDQDKKDRDSLKADVQEFHKYGLIFSLDKTEEKITQETPIKIADLIMHCNTGGTGGTSFTITLENCVQTNISWYLGDGVSWGGEVFGGLNEDVAEREEKELAKQEKYDREKKKKLRKEFLYDSMRVVRPGWEADYTSFEFEPDKEGKPMHGYYLLKSGEMIDAVIAYQKPEFLVGDLATSSKLYICRNASDSKVDLLNPDKEANFKEYISKEDISAFFIGDVLFKNYENVGWRVALNEGVIHSFISVVKVDANGQSSYKSFKQTQKLNGTAYGSILASISSKNKLAMMNDAPEIVADYNNGVRDIYETEVEYNRSFESKTPGQTSYVYGSDYGKMAFEEKYANLGQETGVISTPKKDLGLPEEFVGLVDSWRFKAVFEGDVDMTEEYEEGFLNGKPILMSIEDDGSIIYQNGVSTRRNIRYVEWKYLKTADRTEKELEIDFTIKVWTNDGNHGTEKYTLVSVSDSELIYENKKLNVRWIWTK